MRSGIDTFKECLTKPVSVKTSDGIPKGRYSISSTLKMRKYLPPKDKNTISHPVYVILLILYVTGITFLSLNFVFRGPDSEMLFLRAMFTPLTAGLIYVEIKVNASTTIRYYPGRTKLIC